jgi:hypothetical protein
MEKNHGRSETMHATEIIKRLVDRYATCATYSDAGSVVRWNTKFDKPTQPDVLFKTFFIRPLKLRFYWQSEHGFSKIWSDGVETFSHYEFRTGPEKAPNLLSALTPADSITMGAALRAPMLLLPKLQKQPGEIAYLLSELNRLNTLDSEFVESEDCFCLAGSTSDNDIQVVFWIAKTDFSLRQLRESVSLPPENEIDAPRTVSSADIDNDFSDNEDEDELWSTLITYHQVNFDGLPDYTTFESSFERKQWTVG